MILPSEEYTTFTDEHGFSFLRVRRGDLINLHGWVLFILGWRFDKGRQQEILTWDMTNNKMRSINAGRYIPEYGPKLIQTLDFPT